MFLDNYYGPNDIDYQQFNKYLDMFWGVYSFDPTVENPQEILLASVPAKKCEL